MKFLVCNDDGIDAEGIGVLAEVASGFGEVVVVAPDRQHSGCGHRTTTDEPLTVNDHGSGRFSCTGTPADCARLGLAHFAPDADWVLAGVNHGGNLGIDTAMSGTVAAVREGVQLGRPGIAVSQYHRGPLVWEDRRAMIHAVLEELLGRELRPGWLWNVNLPDPADHGSETPAVVDCPLERGHHAFEYEHVDGSYHYRAQYAARGRTEGTDVDVCFSGRIAVSCIPAIWHD